jgi:hypothetical protein
MAASLDRISRVAAPPLWLAYALVALAAGELLLVWNGGGALSDRAEPTFALVACSIGGLAGSAIARRIARRHTASALVLAAQMLMAGPIFGTACQIMFGPWNGNVAGLSSGFVRGFAVATALVPFAIWIFRAARSAEEARPQSIIRAYSERALGRATALTVALSTAIIFASHNTPLDARAALAVLATCALLLAILFLADIDALLRLTKLDSRSPTKTNGPVVIDFGIGDEVEQRAAPAAGEATYRDNARAVTILRGTRAGARAMVIRGVAFGAIALVASVGVAMWALNTA